MILFPEDTQRTIDQRYRGGASVRPGRECVRRGLQTPTIGGEGLKTLAYVRLRGR